MNLSNYTDQELKQELANRRQLKSRTRLVCFELTMPNRGSWNGKWSGQDNKYYIIRKIHISHIAKFIPDGKRDSYHYSWNDGWGANVSCEVIDSIEARKRRKISKGFCGYEWMINNIIEYGTAYGKEKDLA